MNTACGGALRRADMALVYFYVAVPSRASRCCVSGAKRRGGHSSLTGFRRRSWLTSISGFLHRSIYSASRRETNLAAQPTAHRHEGEFDGAWRAVYKF